MRKILILFAVIAGVTSLANSAWAGCAYSNQSQIKTLTAAFEAWKVVTSAMAECGNVNSELDQEFRTKQPSAFATNPSLYHIGGVANATLIPLLSDGSIRPLDDLVAKYGKQLNNKQLIKIDGKVMAIAMMVNAQHLMYRSDILSDLGIAVPETYQQVLQAAAKIKQANVVDYPLGGTFKTGWNLGEEFINMYLGFGGEFFSAGFQPDINNDHGIAALEMLKRLTAYMDPEYLTSDSTTVQQQFQQGKIAMANLWASRAQAMDDPKESQVVGKIAMAAAPAAVAGGRPASTLWWDGMVIARNISDAEAEAAFRVLLEGIDREMVTANNDVAVWLIDGYKPGKLAEGAAATAAKNAAGYPANVAMGAMHTALGDGVADYLNGAKSAAATLQDIEAGYRKAAKEAGIIN